MAILCLYFPAEVCWRPEYFHPEYCGVPHCTDLRADVLSGERIQHCVYQYNAVDLHQSPASDDEESSLNLQWDPL